MKIALIGTGHLLEALMAGALRADLPADWFAPAVRRDERVTELAQRYGVQAVTSNVAAAREAQLVVLGVTPDALAEVCAEIADALRPGAVVACAVVPADLAALEEMLPAHVAVVRLMPSVAARVGHGICGLALGTRVSADQAELARTFLAASGEVVELPEDRLGALGSLAGSGPAYLAALLQAMADGGERLGIEAAEALRLAVATARGTVELLSDGVQSPADVERAVGHPGGSTVRSLERLESSGALEGVRRAVTHEGEE